MRSCPGQKGGGGKGLSEEAYVRKEKDKEKGQKEETFIMASDVLSHLMNITIITAGCATLLTSVFPGRRTACGVKGKTADSP